MFKKSFYCFAILVFFITGCQFSKECNDDNIERKLKKYCESIYNSPENFLQILNSKEGVSTQKIIAEIKQKPHYKINMVELLNIHMKNKFEFYEIRRLEAEDEENYYTYIVTYKYPGSFLSNLFEGIFHHSEEKINYIFVNNNCDLYFDGISVSQHFPYGKFKH